MSSTQQQQTLTIIKPDMVEQDLIGTVIEYFEKQGLHVIGMKMVQLTENDAKGFYAVHKERGFFQALVQFMTQGPVVVMALEGEDAVAKARKIMGATDPTKADKGTIRGDLADSIDANAIHGSDSLENAKIEIEYFFPKSVGICPRPELKD